jgi:hypothetical protein
VPPSHSSSTRRNCFERLSVELDAIAEALKNFLLRFGKSPIERTSQVRGCDSRRIKEL